MHKGIDSHSSPGDFDEAPHFIIGEMETKRKQHLNEDTTTERLRSISLSLLKWLSLYGQSAVLPLFVWTLLFLLSLLSSEFTIGEPFAPESLFMVLILQQQKIIKQLIARLSEPK